MIGRSRTLSVLLSVCLALVGSAMAQRSPHSFKYLTSQRIRTVMRCHEVDSLFQYDLPAVIIPRVPGTPGHDQVKDYILSRLNQLNCSRWNITEHSFEDDTPEGRKHFTNIIATLDPEVDKRLVLTAHWDSKMTPRGFKGATDSALPVALLLDMALTLDEKLQDRGEAFILLDLIGAASPTFHDMYPATTNIFQRLSKIEQRLHDAGFLESHKYVKYFVKNSASSSFHVEDDHIPFKKRGVPIVHLIALPFPSVWHTLRDDETALDKHTISNLKKIFMVFLHEYFHLR